MATQNDKLDFSQPDNQMSKIAEDQRPKNLLEQIFGFWSSALRKNSLDVLIAFDVY